MVNEQLEDSLRREIESYLDSRLSAIRTEISTLQSLLNESLSTFLDRQADVQMEGSLVASITEHLHAAHERGVELASSQTARAKASSDMAAHLIELELLGTVGNPDSAHLTKVKRRHLRSPHDSVRGSTTLRTPATDHAALSTANDLAIENDHTPPSTLTRMLLASVSACASKRHSEHLTHCLN